MFNLCRSCGHENQEDALYCDECGEELKTNISSTVEETIPLEELEVKVEPSNPDEIVSSEASFAETSNDEIESFTTASAIANTDNTTSDEAEISTILTSETEREEESPPLPMGTATRLEIDEPPKEVIVSPATTLELPELPTAVLIHQETGARFVLPSAEKIAYIGRLNEEFSVQVDLSAIPDADLISRVHAAIHLDNEVYYLEDVGSANGTWLNEAQIQTGTRFRQQLNPGDTIAFGRNQSIKFTFDLED